MKKLLVTKAALMLLFLCVTNHLPAAQAAVDQRAADQAAHDLLVENIKSGIPQPEQIKQACASGLLNPNMRLGTLQVALLSLAVHSLALSNVEALLEGGAKTDSVDRIGNSPQHYVPYAKIAGDATGTIERLILGIIDLLLVYGVDIDAQTNKGDTPLLLAAGFRNTQQVISFLINHGADINAHNQDGVTATMQAAARGDSPLLKELIAANANLILKSNCRSTALTFANRQPLIRQHIIKMLKDAGATV